MADDDSGLPESILVVGPEPKRYTRALELVDSGSTVVLPAIADRLPADARHRVDSVDLDPDAGLPDVGTALTRQVNELTAPDVVVDLDAVGWERHPPIALLQFLILVTRLVGNAGGRLVCTLAKDTDPVRVRTIVDLFDERVRVGTVRDLRSVGELSF